MVISIYLTFVIGCFYRITMQKSLHNFDCDTHESWLRGEKFQKYQTLSSLKEYVLISQKEFRIEVFTRQDDKTWLYHVAAGLKANTVLQAINCTLQLRDIYRKVDFAITSK